MYYASDLLPINDIKSIVSQTGMGVESIEFSMSDVLDNLQPKIKEYRSRLEYYGTSDLTLHGPFLDLNPVSFDSKILEATRCRFSQCYEAGIELGAKKIIYHTCFVPSIYFLDGWAERMADFFHPFMEDRKDIQVLIENVYDKFPEPIRKVKELVDAPNFGLCLDIGHANCYSDISPIEWAKCFGSYIDHVHVHNNDGTYDSHLALDNGTISVEETLNTIHQYAPDATYTIECCAPETVLHSYELLRRYI